MTSKQTPAKGKMEIRTELEIQNKLMAALRTSLIFSEEESEEQYRPSLVLNNYAKGEKVLRELEENLADCQAFEISVAFITQSGLIALKPILKELETRGIPGKILTTNYLNFTEPEALEFLQGLSNVEVRMYMSNGNSQGFHTKCYLFQKDEMYISIIGSSNLTGSALTSNQEWNTKISSLSSGSYIQSIRQEFEALWNSVHTAPYEKIQDEYARSYAWNKELQQKTSRLQSQTGILAKGPALAPNTMQQKFLENLKNLVVEQRQSRALLVSATGTGKTYAAAFAMKELDYDKVLFVIHREQIARTARQSFKQVLGNEYTYGILSGTSYETDRDYIFSTIQTASRPDTLEQFEPEHFDAIIIDEVHRAGAPSYQKLFEYFKPKLWLGMSATPSRTDGYDIYQLFDHNIAYEIRLKHAMEEDLLVPFHYFGIADLEVEGTTENLEADPAAFSRLHLENRVNHMLEQARLYGYSGDRLHGLIFVSTKEEAASIASLLNQKGVRALSLTGEDSQEAREQAIQRLAGREGKLALDYLVTVDIFNEGIDIPEVNQVLLLRPTKSPIIFTQQLGRGLRKSAGKEYTVVLDFIGSYQNNYMIPMAIFDDRTYNKDNLRKAASSGSTILPGASTVHFDEISKKRIFKAIDQAAFSSKRLVDQAYLDLKQRLGRIPRIKDFDQYDSISPARIFAAYESYPALVGKMERTKPSYGDFGMRFINFISSKFGSGKRTLELEAIRYLIKHPETSYEDWMQAVMKTYPLEDTQAAWTNLTNQMIQDYYPALNAKKFEDCRFWDPQKQAIDEKFYALLENQEFLEDLQELINYGFYVNNTRYKNLYPGHSFVLNEKYSYEDVIRLLNWEKDMVKLNIGGYKYDEKTNTFPIFINYHKADDISLTTQYEDELETPQRLRAISKSKRTLSSADVIQMLQADQNNTKVELFVRKNKEDKSDSKEFYYLGPLHPTQKTEEFIMADGKSSAVKLYWNLEQPVQKDIYEYITMAVV